MTITHKQVGAVSQSAVTTKGFNPGASGDFPSALVAGDAGDLLIAVINQATGTLANIATAPSGWSQVAGASTNDNAASGSGALYWKIATASESTYTWTFTSAITVTIEISQYHDSAGGTWTLDATAVNKNAPSTNANNITPGTTGTLHQAAELVFAYACQNSGSNGGTEAIDSSFNLLNPSTTTSRVVDGYLITAATTAQNPSLSWVTSRTRVAGIASFYPATVSPPSDTSGMLLVF